MNQYLVALIGLVVILFVGFVMYGLIFKQRLSDATQPQSIGRIISSAVGMYFIALIFTVLYNDVIFASGATGIIKGLYLGLMVGLSGLMIPMLIDAGYLRSDKGHVNALVTNWVVAFIVLGLVTGIILK